jgi:hypothetical protein
MARPVRDGCGPDPGRRSRRTCWCGRWSASRWASTTMLRVSTCSSSSTIARPTRGCAPPSRTCQEARVPCPRTLIDHPVRRVDVDPAAARARRAARERRGESSSRSSASTRSASSSPPKRPRTGASERARRRASPSCTTGCAPRSGCCSTPSRPRRRRRAGVYAPHERVRPGLGPPGARTAGGAAALRGADARPGARPALRGVAAHAVLNAARWQRPAATSSPPARARPRRGADAAHGGRLRRRPGAGACETPRVPGGAQADRRLVGPHGERLNDARRGGGRARAQAVLGGPDHGSSTCRSTSTSPAATCAPS